MERLIDALPGVSMPVEAVTETLRHMWDKEAGVKESPTDFRASQLNLILHFGLETSAGEARERFDTAIRFAQRYPCRIVVLCPSTRPGGETAFEGKLFSQCYLGRHLRDLCCCEALILGYSPEESGFLESQVSVWLESDLPIYHCLHRVPAARIDRHYLGFLKRCRAVIFDGAVEGGAYGGLDWPHPDRLKDLALARTLPLRQHLGQFLSGFPPAELAAGLQSVEIRYTADMERAARHLLQWQQAALTRCLDQAGAPPEPVRFDLRPFSGSETPACLATAWRYADPQHHFHWRYSRSRKSGRISGQLPSGPFEHPLHIEPLSPEAALAEALFFL